MSGLDFVDYTFRMHSKGGTVVNFQPARWTTTAVDNKHYNAFLAEDGSYVLMRRDFTALTIMYYFTKASDISVTRTLVLDWADKENKTYVEYSALFE